MSEEGKGLKSVEAQQQLLLLYQFLTKTSGCYTTEEIDTEIWNIMKPACTCGFHTLQRSTDEDFQVFFQDVVVCYVMDDDVASLAALLDCDEITAGFWSEDRGRWWFLLFGFGVGCVDANGVLGTVPDQEPYTVEYALEESKEDGGLAFVASLVEDFNCDLRRCFTRSFLPRNRSFEILFRKIVKATLKEDSNLLGDLCRLLKLLANRTHAGDFHFYNELVKKCLDDLVC